MPPNTRERLIEAGLRMLESEGPESLQARKVADEIGASSMTVYTHFGGMRGLLDAIAEESNARFAAALAARLHIADPIADLCALGVAYRDFAIASPQRYRLILGLTTPQLATPAEKLPTADAAFGELAAVVERIVAAGLIRPDPVLDVAGRIWSVIHGSVLLELAGFFGRDGRAVTVNLAPLTVDLLVGMGADRDATVASMASVPLDNHV